MDAPDLTGFARALLGVGGEPERLLEIGCGDGDATLFLAREYPRARVRGVDPDESLVRAASGRVGLDPEGRVAFKSGRPQTLPFPDRHFDLVVQRQGRLSPAELARVIRPEGLLLVPAEARARGALGIPRPAARSLARQGFRPVGADDGEFRLMRMVGAAGGARPA